MRISLLSGVFLLLFTTASRAQPVNPCEASGTAAEQRYGLPPGLLLAVGRVESGRWDPALGRVAPWPWTIDVAGSGRLFGSQVEAVTATTALRREGAANIDVGCFQISLLHHPNAFASMEEAFDPALNAAYAAKFLVSLRDRTGSWPEAVAAYHSADPARGGPYRNLVYAAWGNAANASVAPLPSPQTGLHIWTPRLPGTAPAVILLSAPSGPHARLPRIITPRQ